MSLAFCFLLFSHYSPRCTYTSSEGTFAATRQKDALEAQAQRRHQGKVFSQQMNLPAMKSSTQNMKLELEKQVRWNNDYIVNMTDHWSVMLTMACHYSGCCQFERKTRLLRGKPGGMS